MKVKVGDKIYSDEDTALMVILSDSDKENIKNMPEDATKYASVPDGVFDTQQEFEEWMKK